LQVGMTSVVCLDGSPRDFLLVAGGRLRSAAPPEVGVARLASIALSIFSFSAVSFFASGVGSGFKVGLSELYGSLSANNVGPFRTTGVTLLRSTANSARGKSLAGRSRARRARGSPWTLHGSVGICAAVAISM